MTDQQFAAASRSLVDRLADVTREERSDVVLYVLCLTLWSRMQLLDKREQPPQLAAAAHTLLLFSRAIRDTAPARDTDTSKAVS